MIKIRMNSKFGEMQRRFRESMSVFNGIAVTTAILEILFLA